MRITNNTDETIIIEPGDTINTVVKTDHKRLLASRTKIVEIKEVR